MAPISVHVKVPRTDLSGDLTYERARMAALRQAGYAIEGDGSAAKPFTSADRKWLGAIVRTHTDRKAYRFTVARRLS